MNDMDKLTLELFTNKIQYKKYLSKIEPENYNVMQEFREKCIEYKDEILKKVEYMLTSSSSSSDNFINDPFYKFTNDIISEIEKKREIDKYISEEEEEGYGEERYGEEGYREEEDDDILFPPDKMNENQKCNSLEKYSFWGKERVIQQNYNSDFISHYPTNTSVRRRYMGGRRNSILPKDS